MSRREFDVIEEFKTSVVGLFLEGATIAAGELSDDEANKALNDLVNWLREQKWSNGKLMLVITALMDYMYQEWLEMRFTPEVTPN